MKEVVLLSNGDMREAVGVNCWPKQEATLGLVEKAFARLRIATSREPAFDRGHGFITTQAAACEVVSKIDPDAPVVIVMASWVWAHHLAGALKLHRGPILLLGNFDGTWPGLVSLLNHAASYERMEIPHSRIWSEKFITDSKFMERLQEWKESRRIVYPTNHLSDLDNLTVPDNAARIGRDVGKTILKQKRILGQLDPGCMGMMNAVIDPAKLASIGMPLELLNQSDLVAEMAEVSTGEAHSCLEWIEAAGASFHVGTDPGSELTRDQLLEQMQMYVAAARIYDRYGLAAIGIPYQFGLVRSVAASDLCEGMLNNSVRPEVCSDCGRTIASGLPIVHFNEGDVGSGVPQVLMHDILISGGMAPETTLHDVRWGDTWEGEFIWTFEISGGAAPAHFGGWENTHVYRQPPMYFPKGGGTCSGISKAGTITWARFYEASGSIGMDIGTGEVVELPEAEVNRRRKATNEEWPIANVRIPGYGQDELMSTHMANHITICYGNILGELAATCRELSIPTRVVGDARDELR